MSQRSTSQRNRKKVTSMADELTECGLNLTHPILNYTSCPAQLAYSCLCDPSIICCEQEACDRCFSSDDPRELFTFSWPLVAGWYAMLVVLFCFGRRGRFMPRSGFIFRRQETPARQDRDDEFRDVDPVVKTRRLEESDIGEEAPACCICLNPLVVGDSVAALECPHLYHEECIVEWLKRKNHCPLCAQRIDLEQQHQQETPPPVATSSSRSRSRRLSLARLFSSSSSNPRQHLHSTNDSEDSTDPATQALSATTLEDDVPQTTTTTTTIAETSPAAAATEASTRPTMHQHREQEMSTINVRQ